MGDFIHVIENYLLKERGQECVEEEIKLLFFKISKTKNIDDAALMFQNLEEIQFTLAKAIFKNEIEVTQFLRQFVYDFDRIDDEEIRNVLYKKIQDQFADL
jgi:competence transcription factor ComK